MMLLIFAQVVKLFQQTFMAVRRLLQELMEAEVDHKKNTQNRNNDVGDNPCVDPVVLGDFH
ncbi:MAG: hypothetical protein FD168_294 [Desulfobulbaceae bacterium]|nr:MAG: hypothetical protein FD168_294 [Desulfobulbaceae bacterium]